MKLPKSINILSQIYEVESVPDVIIDENRNMLYGRCLFEESRILIYNYNSTQAFKTLLHEIIHAICRDLNLYDAEHNEKFIDTLATGLTDTLIRNDLIKIKESKK